MGLFGPKDKDKDERDEKTYSGNYNLEVDPRTGSVSEKSFSNRKPEGNDYSKDDDDKDEKPAKKGWW